MTFTTPLLLWQTLVNNGVHLAGGKSAVGLSNQAWLCLDLYDVLARMTEAGHHSAVHQLLDSPIKNCPEVGSPIPAFLDKAPWGRLEISPQGASPFMRSRDKFSIAAASTLPRRRAQQWRTGGGWDCYR